jgi:molybdenum-dependent DNA-binding transcriptional regulator ModE
LPEPKPRVIFVSDGVEITHRQMEALAAVNDKGSMQKAAAFLGVSTPVLHKYVREIEEKSDLALIASTSKGSKLTAEGLVLLKRFKSYELRLEDQTTLRVAGTVVSQRCLLTAATELSDNGKKSIVTIAHDESNLRLMDEGRTDCVVLDDAMYAMERAADVDTEEIGSDMLLQKDAGLRYALLTFGAQRLGFRYLSEKGVPYEIARTIHEPSILNRTDLSYFVNKSLVRTGIVMEEGAKDQRWSLHSITALKCSEHEDLAQFLEEAREAWLYRKG